MNQPEQEKKHINKSSQNRWLPIILWVFPLLLLNIGSWFFNHIDNRWKEEEQAELAKHEVETLAANSEFSYSFSKLASEFTDELKSGAKSFVGNNHEKLFFTYIKSRAGYKFRAPFPEHELFVFQKQSNSSKIELIHSNVDNIKNKRALGLAFEYLYRVNSQDVDYSDFDRKKGADITKNIWGGETNPEVIAETQRGKPSFSFYKLTANRFLWDYFVEEKTKTVFGYFLIVNNNQETEKSAKLIALRELRNSQLKEKNKKLGAFIPLFPGYGGVVAEEEARKIPGFKAKIRKWVPADSKGLYEWQKNAIPFSGEDSKLGNYKASFYVAPGQSHAAVLLIPELSKAETSAWIQIINIFGIVVIAFLLIRGIVWNKWPNTSLKVRFISTYFLAACLPLGLLIIASYAYLSEYQHTALFKNQAKLRNCINQFDRYKTKMQEEYKTAFLEMQTDVDMAEAFKKLELSERKSLENMTPEAKDVLDKAVKFFFREERNLPILSLTVIDEHGGYMTNMGNNDCRYLVDSNHIEHLEKDYKLTLAQKRLKDTNDDTLNALIYPLIMSLRKQIEIVSPESKKWIEPYRPTVMQETVTGSFKTAVGNNISGLSEDLDRRRNLIVAREIRNMTIGHIHNYIYVDGIPRFIIFVVWDRDILDEKAFKKTLNSLAITEPNLFFSAFKASTKGVIPWLGSGRHGKDFEKISFDIANQAYFRNGNASARNDSMSILAMPSKVFSNTIIVGGISHFYMNMSVFVRVWVLVGIILIALLVLLGCIYYSSRIFLKPISNLKESLEEVSSGNFNIDIKSFGNDEFGIMSREFGEMTIGLNERNKLATLISDHAIEALSRNNSAKSVSSDVESFSGVALVSDIRNFTSMCEGFEPDQITDLLNEHFAKMTKIITEHGGRIYKYIGDAIEVVFADRDDSVYTASERALKTALLMLKCIKTINEERKSKGLFTYKIGIGLCYGKMTSGTIGSFDTRLDYAIIGDALKKAAKLENLTKQYPEFPLVVDSAFQSNLSKTFNNIDFKKVIKSDSTEEDCFYTSELSVEKILNLKRTVEKNNSFYFYKKNNESDDNSKIVNSKFTSVIEINENFSFLKAFIPGMLFVIALIALLFTGYNIIWDTKSDVEKGKLASENGIDFNQLFNDDYGKIAFDIKARHFAKILNNRLKKLNYNNITEKIISETLTTTFKNDNSLYGKGFDFAFVKYDNNSDLNVANDVAFVDKLSMKPICIQGYTDKAIQNISRSFKMCETFKLLENNSSFFTNEQEKKDFQNPYLYYMRDNYGEPSREVFGDGVPITVFVEGAKNSTIEGSMEGNPVYLYWLDYYAQQNGKDKLIGYFICSMPIIYAKKSIPFLVSAFSTNNSMIAIKNNKTSNWNFSDNFSEIVKDGILRRDLKKNTDEDYIYQYLKTLPGISDFVHLNISGDSYDIYMVKLCSDAFLNIIIKMIIGLFGIVLMVFLTKLAKGHLFVNNSVAAKLWLTLLMVAVIPVFTVFFVFELYKYEYYSVKSSQEFSNMQEYNELYESKPDFSSPLIWNFIKNKTDSKELYDLAIKLNLSKSNVNEREQALVDLRQLCESWMKLSQNYNEYEKRVYGFNLKDITITGSGGWNFSQSDTKDSLEENSLNLSVIADKHEIELASSVSYIDSANDKSRDGIGLMLSLTAKSQLNKSGAGKGINEKFNKNFVANEVALETGLKAVRTFFGDDTFVRISQGIDLPTVMNVGRGKLGLYLSPVPNFKNPEFIIVWMISFSSYDYLIRMSSFINSRYRLHPAEFYRYGDIALTNDNSWRIPMGELATKIITTNQPIATTLNINNEEYLIDGNASRRQVNSMLVLSCSSKEIYKDLKQMNLFFALLLSMSLFIIAYTTKNIAADILLPLSSLITGIKEIKNENFSFRIESDRTDELGALCSSFDQMAKGLEEKHLMSRMISKTARIVTLKESADATRKTNCVFLYVSIPKFLSAIENANDVDIFANLKHHTSIVAGKIMELGGEVDKIMGEKLLAVFRVKNNDKKSSAIAACNVAKKLIELENSKALPYPIAIGINYGNVINGFLGVGAKRDFTVIGDAVNVTARIESLSEELNNDRCLISDAVNGLVVSDFSSKLYGEVELKGKSVPMKVYQLI